MADRVQSPNIGDFFRKILKVQAPPEQFGVLPAVLPVRYSPPFGQSTRHKKCRLSFTSVRQCGQDSPMRMALVLTQSYSNGFMLSSK